MLAQTRKEPGRLPAGVFAVVVHLLFAGLLIFGVSWQNKQSAPVEAELWNKLPSAPNKSVETPAVPPRPKQEIKKEIPPAEPVKAKPEPKPKVEKQEVQPKPDIALKEKLEKEKKKIEEEKRKIEEEKVKQAESKKLEQDKKKKAAEAKEHEEQEVLKNLLAAQKSAKDKANANAAEAASAANASNAVIGTAMDRIRAKIKQNTQVPPDVAGQPRVVYKLVLLPSGDLLSVTLVKSSGNAAYDDAVARGIQKAAPLPLPPDSSLFSNFRELSLPFTHEK